MKQRVVDHFRKGFETNRILHKSYPNPDEPEEKRSHHEGHEGAQRKTLKPFKAL
jgi:hypothetical protein